MENYSQIFFKPDDRKIFPGESFGFDFSYDPEQNREYRLFFTGEVDNFYFWKTEYGCTTVYTNIADALVKGQSDARGLKFEGADYPVLAFRKAVWPPKLAYLSLRGHTESWTYGVKAKAKDIRIKENGYLRLSIEIRNQREGKIKGQTNYLPDRVVNIDFPEGSYDLTDFGGTLCLPDSEIANVMFILEGENFEGEIVFEAPHLTSSNGYNVMPPFAPHSPIYQEHFNWFGVNLSKTEWPLMQIKLNGREVFYDPFFERSHRYSEKEITLPEGALVKGTNHIEFTLRSDWHDALPYRLHEIGIVEENRHSFDVVSCPEIAVKGKEFALLLDLAAPAALTLTSDAKAVSTLKFEEAGLQALRLRCDRLCSDLSVTLSDGITTHTVTVDRVIEKEEDHVITGTGDLIYVNQADEDTKNYIKWYLSNHIGNLMTIRPTYRWSGTRVPNDALWKKYAALMNALDMNYSHMVDGREPPGFCANPSHAILSADTGLPSRFLGRQYHERDGAYCYWGDFSAPGDFWDNNGYYNTELLFDIFNRMNLNHPLRAGWEFHPEDIFDDGKRYWFCHDPSLPADMEAQAKGVINSLTTIRRDATRHTGPSIFFKYFCMSGYSWIGAETMDSPTEFLLAALRGASEAYGVPTVGVHHALQWSSSPHEDVKRYRRYRLALYVSWMQGVHEHNTEEGLWHMEEYFEAHHRFSVAAKEHLKMQQDFFRYISSHSRQGRLRAKVGILHGKYDGYPCFGGGTVWGRTARQGFNTKFDAEMSWHIPRQSFYPHGVQGWSATAVRRDIHPIGLVSPNPRGCFNIIPVEKDWKDYPFLCFFGYNKAEKEEMDRILEKVKAGSTLLLTLGHLSCTTDRKAIESYQLDFEDHPIFEAMGFDGVPVCSGKNLLGENLKAEDSEILARGEDGKPLIVEKKCGKGSIVFFNTLYYPAHPAIKDLYTAEFERRSDLAHSAEEVYASVEDDVQAVVYDLEDGSQAVYFIAVDWWNDPESERIARLHVGKDCYEIRLPFGVMKKALVKEGRAILCESESADVLRMESDGFVAQGAGKESFVIFEEGRSRRVEADFSDVPQKKL